MAEREPSTILCLSSQRWDEPLWTNKQHIMSRLAASPRVIHVDHGLRQLPGYLLDRLRRRPAEALLPVRLLTDGVARRHGSLYVAGSYAPPLLDLLPPGQPLRDFFEYDFKVRLLRRFLERERITRPLLWVYHPGFAAALSRLPRELLIYDCVDNYAAFPAYRRSRPWLVEREERLCREADLVFTTSRPLYEARRPLNPANTHLVHNVGDAAHFGLAMAEQTAIPKDIIGLPGPRVGFVGALSDYKLNQEWLIQLADRHPRWSVVLIGPVGLADASTEVNRLASRPNVHLLGPRAYADLPGYLKGFDVAVIPYRLNGYTESVFPIKFFEFLGSGKPVVVSDLPALAEYRHLVRVATTAEEFVRHCEASVAPGAAEQGREERLAAARENSWESRIARIMAKVEEKLAIRG